MDILIHSPLIVNTILSNHPAYESLIIISMETANPFYFIGSEKIN
jgi:hypothetical protein